MTAEFAKTVHCGIITQYELILPFFTNTARQVYCKATKTIFSYIDAPMSAVSTWIRCSKGCTVNAWDSQLYCSLRGTLE